MPESEKKTPIEPTNISDYLPIIGLAVILGLLFDYFFFKELPGLSFPIYVALVLLSLFFLAKRFHLNLNRSVILLSVPLLFFSAMIAVRSSGLLTFLNLSISFYLLILIAGTALGLKIQNFFIIDYIKPLILVPLDTLDKIFFAISDLAASRSKMKGKTTSQVLRGIILAVPVLLLFLLLLSSADLVFNNYVSKIIDIEISAETISRTILFLFVTAVFTGIFTHIFLRPVSQFKLGGDNRESRRLGLIEGNVLLGSVDVLFLSFILIQIPYLFGGQRNIGVEGVTYAEYARSGFFQLLAVAVISFLLVWLTEKFIFREDAGHALSFKILGGVLIFEVIVIMASAFKRLMLYESAFGFTVLRFYSHAFTIWLAVIFIILLIKILSNIRENRLALSAFISMLFFLGVFNIMNPDAFIARQNIKRFDRTGKLDVRYLGELSDDAGQEFIEVLDLSTKEAPFDKGLFAGNLYRRHQDLLDVADKGHWQSLNLARTRTLKLLNGRASYLKRYSKRAQRDYDDW